MTGGGIKCWGLDSNGQLGIGETAAFKNIPTDVSLGSGVRTCAVNKMRRERPFLKICIFVYVYIKKYTYSPIIHASFYPQRSNLSFKIYIGAT
jgi:hypothetical protein